MKKLDVSAISNSGQLPLKSGSLVHLQSAYQEAIAQAIISTIQNYDTTKVYILYGLVDSASAPAYNISAGAAFYNGEVFLVDSASGSLGDTQVVVGTIGITFFVDPSADSVTFTDGTNRNIHQIRKIVLTAGLSGSGIANYTAFRAVNPSTGPGIGEIKMYVGSTDDFDDTGLGIAANVRGWAICNGNNDTYDMSGRGPMGYNPSDPDFNAVGTKTGGEKTHILTISELAAHSHVWTTPSSNDNLGGSGWVASSNGPDGNPPTSLNSINSTTGQDMPHNNLQPYRVVLFIQRIY